MPLTVPLEVLSDGKQVRLAFHHLEEAPSDRLPAFPRSLPSGRVELQRIGNRIEARTRGVRRFRLLLSPAQFDFRKPVRVVTNGVLCFEETVTPNVTTLLRWARRDEDRTMLSGAELGIKVENCR